MARGGRRETKLDSVVVLLDVSYYTLVLHSTFYNPHSISDIIHYTLRVPVLRSLYSSYAVPSAAFYVLYSTSTSFVLHGSSLFATFYTLHCNFSVLHSTFYALHSTPCILHSAI